MISQEAVIRSFASAKKVVKKINLLMSTNRVDISRAIIKEHYGPVVQEICSVLLEMGDLTLDEIVQYGRVSKSTVRQCLIIGIHHHIISFYEEPIRDNMNVIKYHIEVDKIILKIRYPVYLYHIKNSFGDLCELILEMIMLEGTVTVGLLLKEIVDAGYADKEGFLEAFRQLRDLGYIKNTSEEKTVVSSLKDHLEEDTSYWIINDDTFTKQFKINKCVELLEEKFDSTVGIIIRAMFKIAEYTHVISEERLFGNLTSIQTEQRVEPISKDKLREYLDLLCKDKSSIIKKVPHPVGYTLDIPSIVTMLQRRSVESVVKDKFGDDSLKIFKLLSMKRMLDQKQVSELSMIPIIETRDSLYKMFGHNFVILQEVPRTSEHNANRTFFLWSIDWNRVMFSITDNGYKVLKNLKLKQMSILSKNQDLLMRAEEEERLQLLGTPMELLTDVEAEAYRESKIMKEKLEHAVRKLDETLMILKDFN